MSFIIKALFLNLSAATCLRKGGEQKTGKVSGTENKKLEELPFIHPPINPSFRLSNSGLQTPHQKRARRCIQTQNLLAVRLQC